MMGIASLDASYGLRSRRLAVFIVPENLVRASSAIGQGRVPVANLQQPCSDIIGVSAPAFPGQAFAQRQDYGGCQVLAGELRQFSRQLMCFIVLDVQVHGPPRAIGRGMKHLSSTQGVKSTPPAVPANPAQRPSADRVCIPSSATALHLMSRVLR